MDLLPRLARAALRSPWCPMAVWVDGMRVYFPSSQETSPFLSARASTRPPPDLERFLRVAHLQAVEIFTLSETPARYQATGSACGTILLWTRIR